MEASLSVSVNSVELQLHDVLAVQSEVSGVCSGVGFDPTLGAEGLVMWLTTTASSWSHVPFETTARAPVNLRGHGRSSVIGFDC